MPGPVFLCGDGVDLRTVERADLDFIERTRNNPRVRHRFPSATPQNGHALEREFEERFSSDESVTLLITTTADDADGNESTPDLIGFVALFRIDETHGTAELGAWVAPDHWDEGYATAAGRAMLAYAFEERRLARVAANALATNVASRTVIEKMGFVEEGRERRSMFVNGGRVDRVTYGLLHEEWKGKSG